MKFNPVSENGKTLDSRIMMLSLILLLWEKKNGWRNACGFLPHQPKWDLLSDNPKLGHITTFGHPVIASACLATLQEIETNRPDGQNFR
jgi:hypothetical protein